MVSKRTFDGETYTLCGLGSTEKVAEARAKVLREQGYNIRIEQKKTPPAGWLIYKR